MVLTYHNLGKNAKTPVELDFLQVQKI